MTVLTAAQLNLHRPATDVRAGATYGRASSSCLGPFGTQLSAYSGDNALRPTPILCSYRLWVKPNRALAGGKVARDASLCNGRCPPPFKALSCAFFSAPPSANMETMSQHKLLAVGEGLQHHNSGLPHTMISKTDHGALRRATGRAITALLFATFATFALLSKRDASSYTNGHNNTFRQPDRAAQPVGTVQWGTCEQAALPGTQCGYAV